MYSTAMVMGRIDMRLPNTPGKFACSAVLLEPANVQANGTTIHGSKMF